jgi:hypothetical protein
MNSLLSLQKNLKKHPNLLLAVNGNKDVKILGDNE